MSTNAAVYSTRLELTPLEDHLCRLLSDVCEWIASQRPQPQDQDGNLIQGASVEYGDGNWSCEARLAGGWVRDKILRLPSSDLDVSLSALTGHVFALLLRQYLASDAFQQSFLARDEDSPFALCAAGSRHGEDLVGTISKIEANPDQSKNLETATARVGGLQLDFVNLRKEVYLADSRIPQMAFGTPQEDAERRDITINSLFFNVHSRQVEDFTGKGLADLAEGIIRTPLLPLRTFMDDPLRVLRCIRFASRFDYRIHQSILDCLKGDASAAKEDHSGEQIRHALSSKVSRERVGIEIDKMLKGPRPRLAIELISQLGLTDLVFRPLPAAASLHVFEPLGGKLGPPQQVVASERVVTFAAAALEAISNGPPSLSGREGARRPEGSGSALADPTDWAAQLGGLQEQVPSDLRAALDDAENRRRLFLHACLLPLHGLAVEERKGKWIWAGDAVILQGLKLGVKGTKEPLNSLHRACQILRDPHPECFDPASSDYRGRHIPQLYGSKVSQRATIGLTIQQPYITNPDIGMSLPVALLASMLSALAQALMATRGAALPQEPSSKTARNIISPHIAFWAECNNSGLLARSHERCRLNGVEITRVLGDIPGPLIPRIQAQLLAYQFDHGAQDEDIGSEACARWLKAEWEAGRLVPEAERTGPTKKKKGQRGETTGPIVAPSTGSSKR